MGDEVNESFGAAATDPRFAGILGVTEAPIVSADIIGQAYSCLFSACDTMARTAGPSPANTAVTEAVAPHCA